MDWAAILFMYIFETTAVIKYVIITSVDSAMVYFSGFSFKLVISMRFTVEISNKANSIGNNWVSGIR